jgi:protein involved in polysaccharide export with SLBB domain
LAYVTLLATALGGGCAGTHGSGERALRRGEVIDISIVDVEGRSHMTFRRTIGRDGRIDLPIFGEPVRASGFFPKELAGAMAREYGDVLGPNDEVRIQRADAPPELHPVFRDLTVPTSSTPPAP